MAQRFHGLGGRVLAVASSLHPREFPHSANHLLPQSDPAWVRFQQAVGPFLGWSQQPLHRHRPRPTDRLARNTAPLEILTTREMDILRRVALAESNKEIAARLRISPKTVRNHLTAVFNKLELA